MSPYLLASSLGPANVGRRVVVRFALPGGQATDVLGELESWTADDLSVRRRDGSAEVVPLTAVLAGKAVEAHWPRDVAVGELERVASEGWRAVDRVALGSWELRAAGGFTKRANSVLPVGSPGLPVEAAVAAVESWYGSRGLLPRFQVPLPLCRGLDGALAERGWSLVQPTHVLVAALAELPGVPPVAPYDVVLASMPSDAWIAAQTVPSDNDNALAVLTAGTVAIASVSDGEAVVGTARGSVGGLWLGINALEVAESHRRRGLATALMSGLVAWGAERGATRAYLQVIEANEGARALYERFGFAFHHRYHYREAPPADRVDGGGVAP